ncbi:MAG: prepilin-type N-terminal cleavage/methylation domain-containing protein [Candidatus Omnitrophota bacterium]
MNARGFTLIELLVVVAIIGILVMIVVPNFLNAMIRSKIARSQADILAVSNALMMYRVDNNSLPPLQTGSGSTILLKPTHVTLLTQLTTPVSYIGAGAARSPFSDYHGYWYYGYEYFVQDFGGGVKVERVFYWNNIANKETAEWMITTLGPNIKEFPYDTVNNSGILFYDYNPTNGLNSRGFIQKHGK